MRDIAKRISICVFGLVFFAANCAAAPRESQKQQIITDGLMAAHQHSLQALDRLEEARAKLKREQELSCDDYASMMLTLDAATREAFDATAKSETCAELSQSCKKAGEDAGILMVVVSHAYDRVLQLGCAHHCEMMLRCGQTKKEGNPVPRPAGR